MFDRIRRLASNANLRALTANSIPCAHSDDISQLQYKDKSGVLRTIVTTDNTQTLTNKTVPAPGAVAPDAYGADGAITIKTGTAKITKGTAAAMTLAAPTAGQEGTILRIVSDSAAAHVVTATSLVNDGITGAPHTTMTFAAFPGASIELVAINLKWAVVSKNVVTIT